MNLGAGPGYAGRRTRRSRDGVAQDGRSDGATTGVHYRAVANPSFMDNLLRQVELIKSQGIFSLPISGDLEQPSACTRDIAATAATLLLDDLPGAELAVSRSSAQKCLVQRHGDDHVRGARQTGAYLPDLVQHAVERGDRGVELSRVRHRGRVDARDVDGSRSARSPTTWAPLSWRSASTRADSSWSHLGTVNPIGSSSPRCPP